MNKPTEHEKQTAHAATIAAHRRGEIPLNEPARFYEKGYLAAITAAKHRSSEEWAEQFVAKCDELADAHRAAKQQNEDAARLDWLKRNWQVKYGVGYVQFTWRKAIDFREAIDVARGVQPVAKYSPFSDPVELHESIAGGVVGSSNQPAEKQESAPDNRRHDVAKALEDLRGGFIELAEEILNDMLTVGFAPSPAQEKPKNFHVGQIISFQHGPNPANTFAFKVLELGADGNPSKTQWLWPSAQEKPVAASVEVRSFLTAIINSERDFILPNGSRLQHAAVNLLAALASASSPSKNA